MEFLRPGAEMGHRLHRGGAGADDTDDLVVETGQAAILVAAGIGIVPPAGVKGVTLEVLDPWNARQLRLV